MITPATATSPGHHPEVVAALATVDDPEYPGVSVLELGLVEDVRRDGGAVEIDLLPTFSGCPALRMIAADVEAAVQRVAGVRDVHVRFVGRPAWTPARIDAGARRRLAERFGVAVHAPVDGAGGARTGAVTCPACGAEAFEQSLFGPVRCRSVHRCASCGEPVEVIR